MQGDRALEAFAKGETNGTCKDTNLESPSTASSDTRLASPARLGPNHYGLKTAHNVLFIVQDDIGFGRFQNFEEEQTQMSDRKRTDSYSGTVLPPVAHCGTSVSNRGFERAAQCFVLAMMFSVLAFADAEAAAIDEPATVAADGSAAAAAPDPDRLHVDIYPIFGWVPFFTSNFTVPPLPSAGGGGQSIGGSTNVKFSGAAVFAADVMYKKLLVEGEGMFANVSGNRATPHATVSTHFDYGDLFVGWDVWKGIYPTVGFRRIALDISAMVLDSPTFTRKPGVWDPLLGVEYRKQLKHKLNVQGRFDIGGFGVGSTVDLDAQVRLEWRFVKHFGTLIGYQVLYDKLTGTVNQQVLDKAIIYPWKYAQTFHGPILGIGIYF